MAFTFLRLQRFPFIISPTSSSEVLLSPPSPPVQMCPAQLWGGFCASVGAPPLPPSLLCLSSFFHSSWMVLPLLITAPEQRSNLDLPLRRSVPPAAQMGRVRHPISARLRLKDGGRFSCLFPCGFITGLQRMLGVHAAAAHH